MVFVLIKIVYFREPPSPCKNLSLINDGMCDLINFNENCKFDGKDCCPNPTSIGNGHCDPENVIKLCNYDGHDCCNPGDGKCNPYGFNRMCDFDKEWEDCCELETVNDGFCDVGNLNRMCDLDGELHDCSCDYDNLTRDGICNPANNKSICLFDDYDCLCSKSTLVNGVHVDCLGNVIDF